jgi:superfamily II RNA helicase
LKDADRQFKGDDWGPRWQNDGESLMPPAESRCTPRVMTDHCLTSPLDPLDLVSDYIERQRQRGIELYVAQEEALLELASGKNVILNTPTGSGKSLVAAGLHDLALRRGVRSVYTCPIKALVNEKFLALCQEFGAENVGLATGDGAVNSGAPILCCTAEILMNDALRDGTHLAVGEVIMDEFHYFSDRERGVAWQVPLLAMPQARFLLMSATLGETDPFEKGLTRLNGRDTAVIRSAQRPVPLEPKYVETSLQETVTELVRQSRAPVYIVNFSQAAAANVAQDLLSVDFCTKEEKKAIGEFISGTPFNSPYGRELQRLIRHGIGIHHAGLLPRYRILVERLAQKGLLKIISGTDTLGVGVNVPIRTVLFTQLYKFDGEKSALLTSRDFHQIAGRAGRRGFDDIGYVMAQAPEHVVENLKLEAKAGGDPKKLRKIVRRKPPEKGYVHYSKETFEKLMTSTPEALQSRFKVTHGMLLQVLSRTERHQQDGCEAMRELVRDSYETEAMKERHRREGWQLFRSLVDREIIQLNPFRVNVNLQEDFSLFQALSLFLIDTLKLLEVENPDHALDTLTLVESILENPEAVLRKQVDELKTAKLAELKEQGVEYEQRMEELEKIEHPKPRRDFIYDTFNEFARKHPWVGQENIRPKSIARDMYETFSSFSEYIRDYGLQRSEGLLLRYLSETYRTLVQSVPSQHKTDEIEAIEIYLGTMIRGVDASLLEEWEKMRFGAAVTALKTPGAADLNLAEKTLWDEGPRGEKLLRLSLRNEVFQILRLISRRDLESILDRVELGTGVLAPNVDEQIRAYFQDHQRPRTDAHARGPEHFRVDASDPTLWKIEQTLVDVEQKNDFAIRLELPIAQSRLERRIILRWVGLGEI